MGKLLILSLDESEQNLYSKIMKIVNEAGISADKIIDQGQSEIGIGKLAILPAQRKVLKRDQEVSLTNIEFRILYALALHQGNILSKEQIYNIVWNGEYLRDDSNITSHPVLRWMMDNIFIRTDPAGNIKPDKEKSTEKIDRGIRCGNDTSASVYDVRGILFI